MWGFIEVITAFFKFGESANRVAEKALPSPEIQKEKFEITKETLSETELNKRIKKRNDRVDEMFGDLVRHPEIEIEVKVRQEMFGADEEEIKLTVKLLTARLEADERYIKRKAKQSKFRLSFLAGQKSATK